MGLLRRGFGGGSAEVLEVELLRYSRSWRGGVLVGDLLRRTAEGDLLKRGLECECAEKELWRLICRRGVFKVDLLRRGLRGGLLRTGLVR